MIQSRVTALCVLFVVTAAGWLNIKPKHAAGFIRQSNLFY